MADSPSIHTETVTLRVSDGTSMDAYVARPSDPGAYPGIIVFQEAFGVNDHIRDVTRRFAAEGFVAIAPPLFHRTDPHVESDYSDFNAVRPHMSALTDDGQSADIWATYEWLTDHAKVTGIVTIGYCMGGRTSFLADAILPIKAAASYYGGGIAPAGHGLFPDLLGRASELHAPILLVWGGKDAHITPDLRRAVDDALVAADKPHVVVTFSQADHAFFCDARPSYDPEASRQAWALTLEFFAIELKK